MPAERIFVHYVRYAKYTIVTPFLRCMNDVLQAGRMLVNSSVPPITKCTIIYYEQTARPRSANLCAHIHVDKLPQPSNFCLNCQRP